MRDDDGHLPKWERIGIIAVMVFFTLAVATMAEEVDESPPVVLYAQDIPASELVGLLYREIFQKPFVTSPSVQANRAPVSVHIEGTQAHAVSQAADYLAALGFVITPGNGVDRVELPGPLPEEVEPEIETRPYFYKPKWRDPAALAAILAPLYPDVRFSGSAGEAGSSAQTDSLVVHGTVEELGEIAALLERIDTAVSDLVVKAAVFEVGTDAEDGSAFQLALTLLKGNLDVGVNSAAVAGGDYSSVPALLGSFLSIRSASIEAVISSLSTDSRFNLVTSPSVRARSGSETSFSVGQSVPVLGSVSYPEGGGSTPVQSVEYRDAGVIFTVRPIVQEEVITLDLHQEISDFVATTTGVNSTPTLTRRSLETTLSLQDGDVVMLGGLTKTKTSDAREGFAFLPDFLKQNREGVSRTDLLLVLQVQRLEHGADVLNFARTRAPIPVRRPGPAPTAAVLQAIQSGQGGLF